MKNAIASFPLDTTEGKMRAFNAQNGASQSLKEIENGTVIECTGVLQYNDTIDTYQQGQEGTITVLFATDGESYASVSDSVAKAGKGLIEFLEESGLESFSVAVVRAESKSGREFLNLKLVG